MRNDELDDGLDLEMDERLARFARSTREPALPDEVARLPWTVQLDEPRPGRLGLMSGIGGGLAGFRRTAFGLGRLAVTLAVAGAFLLAVGNVRTSGSAADMAPGPAATPRPSSAPAAPSGREVVVVKTSGVVDDVMADYIAGAISRAESDNAAAVVIELDTLGGSEAAMRRIIKSMEASKVPTIVWVGPGGAKAASAGTFITLAANLAYMSRSTNIGAASPVAAGGADIAQVYGQTEADKIMSDAIAYITAIAQKHHPQAVDWAVSTVAKAQSYSADQALAAGAINGTAETIEEVLSKADGQKVTTATGEVVLDTKNASTVTVNESVFQWFLHTLDDPNIAFILLVIGVLLVAIEFFHPTLLMGIAGALCLALAFYGSGSLPLNILGVVLVILGIAMLILEPSVPSHGLLTLGGIAVFIVGAVAFYGSPGPYLPSAAVAWPIIIITAGLATAYGVFLVGTLMQMRRQPMPVGAGLVGVDGVVGLVGEVQRDLAPLGTVYVGRESWSARAEDGTALQRNTKVQVIRQEGLTLIVKKVE
jgi:membrane-bound serine protease (ClpP class)